MAKRDDIHKILIIGSGPIVIGQACEFDYSGTFRLWRRTRRGSTDPECIDKNSKGEELHHLGFEKV